MAAKSKPPPRDWERSGIGTALLILVTLAAYLPALQAGFIWDDDSVLTDNDLIKSPHGLYYIWFSTYLPDYFPLTSTSFWLEYRLWGLKPFGYHVVNVLLHGLSAALFWRVLRRLKIPGAWLAAAIFAVHPVNVESVAWITERKNTLSMFFYALTLLCFLRFDSDFAIGNRRSAIGNSKWYWLSLLAFLLALLAKTSVVMLPFVLLLCVWWRRSDKYPNYEVSKYPITRGDLVRVVPFFVLSLVLGLVTLWFQYHRAIGADVVRTDDFWTRLAGAGCAVWFYLYKALLPVNLTFVYPRWELNGHSLVSYLPMLALVASLALCWRYRWSWGRAAFFAFGYFVLMLVPVLGFLNIYFQRYSFVADHWQYFSIIGITALVAGGLSFKFERPDSGDTSIWNFRLAAGALVALLSVMTWRQTRSYADSQTLWRTTLARNPACWMAHNNWGLTLAREGRPDEAIEHFTDALRIKPDQTETHNNLGTTLLEQGKLDEAMAHFIAARDSDPNFAMAYYNIANVLDQRGKRQEAIAQYQKALQLNPDYAEAHNNLACVLAMEGDYPQAIAHFRNALRARPDYPDAQNNLGSALTEMGKAAEAIIHLTRAVDLKPDYADAYYNLGNALWKRGRIREATSLYLKALAFKPQLAEAHYKLGNIFLKQQNTDEAVRRYSAALQAKPDYAEPHYQLAVIFSARKQTADTIAHFREAVRLKPDWLEALNNLAWILATHPDKKFRNGAEAMRLATHAVDLTARKNPNALDTLAAACAEAGRFDEAVKAAQEAEGLAQSAGQKELAAQLHQRLELYQRGQPARE